MTVQLARITNRGVIQVTHEMLSHPSSANTTTILNQFHMNAKHVETDYLQIIPHIREWTENVGIRIQGKQDKGGEQDHIGTQQYQQAAKKQTEILLQMIQNSIATPNK